MKIDLYYHLESEKGSSASEILDRTSQVAQNIKRGMDYLEGKEVEYFLLRHAHNNSTDYGVSVRDCSSSVLEGFVDVVGIPDFVESNKTGYSTMDKILVKHDKKLKRCLGGLFVGKHIIGL